MSGDTPQVRVDVVEAVVIPYEPVRLAGDGYAMPALREVADRE